MLNGTRIGPLRFPRNLELIPPQLDFQGFRRTAVTG